jgi:hypothetical protein
MLKCLRQDICDFHHVTESATISDTDEMDAFDPSVDIETSGSGLSAMATIGRFSLCYADIVANAAEYGLDARDAMDELVVTHIACARVAIFDHYEMPVC